MSRRLTIPLFAFLLIAGLALRVTIALSFSTSSPDGDQYYALSQSLLRDGRYAYGPPPAPLTYTRLPGYPILTAAIDGKPRTREAHVQRAAIANAVFDMATALALALLLITVGSRWAAALAIVGVVFCPLLVLQSTTALTESFATLLATIELFLLVRVWQGKRGGYLLAAGAVAGVAQLVRLDALTLLPAMLLATAWSPGSVARRAGSAGAIALTALLLFSPWPIRNALRFGHAHPQAAEWLAQSGDPLPTGLVRWMATWNSSAPGEAYISDALVFGRHFSAATAGVILPQMYDSPRERRVLVTLLDRIGKSGIDATTDRELVWIARERAKRNPWRTYACLPLKRLPRLLMPPPRKSLGWVKIPLLGWPDRYAHFPIFYVLTYALSIVGTILLASAGHGRFAAIMWTTVLARIALYSFAVPHQVSSRYFVEAFPILILLAAYSIVPVVRLGAMLLRTFFENRIDD